VSIVKIILPAGPHERWGKGGTDGMIGQDFTAKHEDTPVGSGKVIDAKVIDEGRALEITVEWPEEL
jgi:hypothetical protein